MVMMVLAAVSVQTISSGPSVVEDEVVSSVMVDNELETSVVEEGESVLESGAAKRERVGAVVIVGSEG